MSIAHFFTANASPRITLRRSRPRLSARQRADRLICRLVVATLCVMVGFVALPLIFSHPQNAELSAQVVVDSGDAESAAGAPVRVIPIYHEQD
jgi:hypothetical protein